MHLHPRICAAFVALAMPLACATAAPLSYDEALEGDLTATVSAVGTVFALDTGENTVVGRYGTTFNEVGGWLGNDFDAFSFSLLPGQLLTHARLEAWDAGGFITFLRWGLLEGSLAVGDGDLVTDLETVSPGVDDVDLALGAGDYHFAIRQYNYLVNPPAEHKLGEYRLTLTIRDADHAVPAPGTLALAATGLLLASRRQARRG